jgi:hypothetical protein
VARDPPGRAGFDRLYPFRALGRAAVTKVCRASRDLLLALRLAGRASPLTTIVYTRVCDEEPFLKVEGVPCGARNERISG